VLLLLVLSLLVAICRAAVQHLALPRARLAGAKGQAVQLLLQQGNVQLMQVGTGHAH
jgi:hypothetical protein